MVKTDKPAPAPVPGTFGHGAGSGEIPAQAETGRPSDAQIMDWLAQVPDPEIPAISLVDLGVIQGLHWHEDTLEVTVTPTYSGCPATAVINFSIEAALRERGIADVRLKQQISPPWTTDWISAEGREKLEAYGIAPPQPAGGPAQCPLCKSANVQKVSQFGSTPCKAQWRCADCLEPFDYFKCI